MTNNYPEWQSKARKAQADLLAKAEQEEQERQNQKAVEKAAENMRLAEGFRVVLPLLGLPLPEAEDALSITLDGFCVIIESFKQWTGKVGENTGKIRLGFDLKICKVLPENITDADLHEWNVDTWGSEFPARWFHIQDSPAETLTNNNLATFARLLDDVSEAHEAALQNYLAWRKNRDEQKAIPVTEEEEPAQTLPYEPLPPRLSLAERLYLLVREIVQEKFDEREY